MNKLLFIASCASLAALSPLCGGDLASLLTPVAPAQTQDAAATANAAPAPAAQPAPAKESNVFIGQNELVAELRNALAAKFKPEGTLSVEALQTWQNLRVADSNWRLELTRVSGQALASHVTVNFRISCGNNIQGEFQLQISCSLMREVLVSSRRFNRAENLDADSFQIQTRDVLELAGTPLATTQDLGDIQMRGSISEGQVLCSRDVEPKPLVRRGQIVEAVATEGHMRIAIKAVVMEDGRAGDLINVRNLSSNKDIQARILNDHTVQVYF